VTGSPHVFFLSARLYWWPRCDVPRRGGWLARAASLTCPAVASPASWSHFLLSAGWQLRQLCPADGQRPNIRVNCVSVEVSTARIGSAIPASGTAGRTTERSLRSPLSVHIVRSLISTGIILRSIGSRSRLAVELLVFHVGPWICQASIRRQPRTAKVFPSRSSTTFRALVDRDVNDRPDGRHLAAGEECLVCFRRPLQQLGWLDLDEPQRRRRHRQVAGLCCSGFGSPRNSVADMLCESDLMGHAHSSMRRQ